MTATINYHSSVLFWTATTVLALGFGMALAALCFQAFKTAIIGMLMMFVSIVLLLMAVG